MPKSSSEQIRNIAIVAHVDHGKTSLVDAMLKFSHVFRADQKVRELILDSNPLERERGITILAKNTAIIHQGVKINIIDTPGHVDFSGEVERVVNMADGCLLVVDALDGPMPQTKSVLRTALGQGLKPVVVINKIDRSTAYVAAVEEAIQDLFLQLATDVEQLEFPVLYTSARNGYAVSGINDIPIDMTPLFDAIIESVPPPKVDLNSPFQLLVAALEYDNHLGQIAVGRVSRGVLQKGSTVVKIGSDGIPRSHKVSSVMTFENLSRKDAFQAIAGDIVAIAGVQPIAIGDTIADPERPEALPRIVIEEPTVKMTFGVNTSPFAGQEGQYATSRMLLDRLRRELQTNVALRMEETDSADEFLVSGRGELHLAILIETIRREGLEIQVSSPEAVTRIIDGQAHEPFERLTIETSRAYFGILAEELSCRLAQMTDMTNAGDSDIRLVYELPTRGLIGFRNFFLRSARGNGTMNSEFIDMRKVNGHLQNTRQGAMVASEPGTTVTYALLNAQDRGTLFVDVGTKVYEGMVCGLYNRDGDLNINVCKERKVTNMRSATSEITQKLYPPDKQTLEEALGLIDPDELLEVTPSSLRLRKRVLSADGRYRLDRNRTKSNR